ncbi:MAG: RNA 2'-phosphotransferase [Acidimicrobiales bacterium]
MDPADVRRSRRLSLVLRHRPGTIGITLDRRGWVSVTELLAALADHGIELNRDDLARVVESNDKQRFEWDTETDRIRACQGHSVEVDLGLTASSPPVALFHGTPRRNVASILATGLDRRGRHHVHLSADVATAQRVGASRGEFVVFRVDAARMAAVGIKFWRTDNGVWLTHWVPPEFLTELLENDRAT